MFFQKLPITREYVIPNEYPLSYGNRILIPLLCFGLFQFQDQLKKFLFTSLYWKLLVPIRDQRVRILLFNLSFHYGLNSLNK